MAQIRRRRRMLNRTCPFAAESLENLGRLRQLVSEMRNELDEIKYFDRPGGGGIRISTGLAPGGSPEVARKQAQKTRAMQMRQQSRTARAELERGDVSPSTLRAMRSKLQAQGLLGKTDDVPAVHKSSGMRIMIRGARAT